MAPEGADLEEAPVGAEAALGEDPEAADLEAALGAVRGDLMARILEDLADPFSTAVGITVRMGIMVAAVAWAA